MPCTEGTCNFLEKHLKSSSGWELKPDTFKLNIMYNLKHEGCQALEEPVEKDDGISHLMMSSDQNWDVFPDNTS